MESSGIVRLWMCIFRDVSFLDDGTEDADRTNAVTGFPHGGMAATGDLWDLFRLPAVDPREDDSGGRRLRIFTDRQDG